jgi:predicted small metal-binding protein
MPAIDCPCGHRLEGADDDELFRLARKHVDRDHPETQRTDNELRARVQADAYEVP